MLTLVDEVLAAEEELGGVSPDAWYERLERRNDELQAALEELREQDVHRGLHVAAVVWPYWAARGRVLEGRGWLGEFLERTQSDPPTVQRARALVGAGLLAFLQGEPDRARAHLEESLLDARELGEPSLEADALIGLARVAMFERDPLTMEQRALEGADAARAGSDERKLATALHHVAEALRRQGRVDEAIPVYREAIARHQALGDSRSVALELHNLGRASRQAGDRPSALDLCHESLALALELKHYRLVGYCLLDVAGMAAEDGDLARAASLIGTADGLFAGIGAALEPEYADERRRTVLDADGALGTAESALAYESGAKADVLRVVRETLGHPGPGSYSAPD